MNMIWIWLAAPVVAVPVWWLLKEAGYVTWCPIRTFTAQSARIFSQYFRRRL